MKWCERINFMPFPYFGLCKNEAEFKRACKRMKVPAPSYLGSSRADMTAHIFDHSKGHTAIIVCVGSVKKRKVSEINALIVHEAVHIWQRVRESIREEKPSSEFEAYAIQFIAQELMEAYHGR